MTVPALITYPARPIQGERLELAPLTCGLWYAEPKLNGVYQRLSEANRALRCDFFEGVVMNRVERDA